MNLAYASAVALVRVLVRVFFRRVEVAGTENLPETGGGLIVAWHPNGLVDPGLILAHCPRSVAFGARHERLRAERGALFEVIMTFAAGLELPGRVAADGRIVR